MSAPHRRPARRRRRRLRQRPLRGSARIRPRLYHAFGCRRGRRRGRADEATSHCPDVTRQAELSSELRREPASWQDQIEVTFQPTCEPKRRKTWREPRSPAIPVASSRSRRGAEREVTSAAGGGRTMALRGGALHRRRRHARRPPRGRDDARGDGADCAARSESRTRRLRTTCENREPPSAPDRALRTTQVASCH